MTTVRLAYTGAPVRGLEPVERPGRAPSLLVSYAYWNTFVRVRGELGFRSWVLDSGAMTVWNSGGVIHLADYIDFCIALLRGPTPPEEIFGLDVIGDHESSRQNLDAMHAVGLKAIPTFHIGEPWNVLEDLAASFRKIAIGGAVGISKKRKMAWVEEVFARAYPCKIHGFGMYLLLRFPFHSVDASNCMVSPVAYAVWPLSFRARLPKIPRESMNVRVEVEAHLELERKAKARWRREFEEQGWQ